MAALILDCAQIIQRAVVAYNRLIELYQQDQNSSPYFAGCLAQALMKRNGLQERLANPMYLADVFKDTYLSVNRPFLGQSSRRVRT
jgi:hypothetical protein